VTPEENTRAGCQLMIRFILVPINYLLVVALKTNICIAIALFFLDYVPIAFPFFKEPK
jgi:hypothetical protein